jgi:hypothetical protein
MSLKSISPFIASVLLISFTIASGIIIYYFVTTLPKVQTQQVSSLSQQVISCSGGFFDLKNFNGIYRKPITIYPFNFVNSSDSGTLTINTTNNQLQANHSFYLVKVSPFPSYARLTIYYQNLTSTASGALFDIFVNGNKLGTLTVPSGISSYTFTNVSINWLVSNALNNITYQNASINLDSLQIINSTLNYNATLSNDLNDYQILITIDTASLISQGKLKNDCSDIRFLDSDDKTLLNYWIESDCNTTNTKIWVKVPFIPSLTTKTIYVYYGNPSATSLSNGDNTFIFFDDFESYIVGQSPSKTKWPYQTYGWKIYQDLIGKVIRYEGGDNITFGVSRIINNVNISGGFAIEALMKSEAGKDAYPLILTRNEINSSLGFGYLIGWGWWGSKARIHYVNGSHYFVLSSLDNNVPTNYTRITITHTNEGLMELIRENTLLVSSINTTYITGFIGIGAWYFFGNSSYWDWFSIRKYNKPEPSINIDIKENTTISLLSSGNPSASMGNQFTAIIYLTNGTILQKDFSLDNNCNLGKDCIFGKGSINLNSNVPIDKIRVCSKACSLICNEIKVS